MLHSEPEAGTWPAFGPGPTTCEKKETNMSEAVPEKSAAKVNRWTRSMHDKITWSFRDPLEVASRLDLVVTSHQGKFLADCPWCRREGSYAFLDADLGVGATCYRCLARGDVFDLIALRSRLDPQDLAEVLRARLTHKEGKILAEKLDDIFLYNAESDRQDLAEVLRARLTHKEGKSLAENLDDIFWYNVMFVHCPVCCEPTLMMVEWFMLRVHCYHCGLGGDVLDLVAATMKLEPVRDHAQVQRATADLAGFRRRRKLQLALTEFPEHFEEPAPPAPPPERQ